MNSTYTVTNQSQFLKTQSRSTATGMVADVAHVIDSCITFNSFCSVSFRSIVDWSRAECETDFQERFRTERLTEINCQLHKDRIQNHVALPKKEVTLGPLNRGVVYPKSSYKNTLPFYNKSLKRSENLYSIPK